MPKQNLPTALIFELFRQFSFRFFHIFIFISKDDRRALKCFFFHDNQANSKKIFSAHKTFLLRYIMATKRENSHFSYAKCIQASRKQPRKNSSRFTSLEGQTLCETCSSSLLHFPGRKLKSYQKTQIKEVKKDTLHIGQRHH